MVKCHLYPILSKIPFRKLKRERQAPTPQTVQFKACEDLPLSARSPAPDCSISDIRGFLFADLAQTAFPLTIGIPYLAGTRLRPPNDMIKGSTRIVLRCLIGAKAAILTNAKLAPQMRPLA